MKTSPQPDYSWLRATLDSWLAIEDGNARRAAVRAMASEIVAACRANRDRVRKAEAIYEKYRSVMSHADKQDVLRLMAETLLYVQYGGLSIKTTDDPTKLLGG